MDDKLRLVQQVLKAWERLDAEEQDYVLQRLSLERKKATEPAY